MAVEHLLAAGRELATLAADARETFGTERVDAAVNRWVAAVALEAGREFATLLEDAQEALGAERVDAALNRWAAAAVARAVARARGWLW